MEKKSTNLRESTDLRVEEMLRPQLDAVLELHQKCFGYVPDPDIFKGKTRMAKVVIYYEDKTALEQAEEKWIELDCMPENKAFFTLRRKKIIAQYSEFLLKAKLVILGFIVYDYDATRTKIILIRIGAEPKNAADAGKKLLDDLIARARKEKRQKLAITPGAVPKTMCFLFPLSPTEPEGIFLLNF